MTPRRNRTPFQPLLEESPEFRRVKLARRRVIRRVIGVAFMVVLIGALAWTGWALWSLRDFSVRTQTPMRSDSSARGRLDATHADTTLLVVRDSGESTRPIVAILKQPKSGNGSWLLALPEAPMRASAETSGTPGELLEAGRVTLLRAVEELVQSGVGHYVEVDGRVLASATADWDPEAVLATSAPTTSSPGPSAALAALSDTAARYRSLRTLRLAAAKLPALARALTGSVASDLGATDLDRMLVRLGTDAAGGLVRVAVVPVETVNRKRVVSVTAARVLAERMRNGRDFGKVEATVERVAPGSLTVTVLNGAGREGVAAQAARILRRAGYRVKNVGNANQFVYDRTLVIYDDRRLPAESVARDLRTGKIVASRGMYSFKTDILVIVGADWPQAP